MSELAGQKKVECIDLSLRPLCEYTIGFGILLELVPWLSAEADSYN